MTNPAHSQDANTGEDIASTTVPPKGTLPKRNAFSALMSPKKPSKKVPPSDTPQSDPARTTTFLGRDGLGAYIASPASFPASRVIYHNEKWVVINDLFPKSSVHILLLPRDPSKQLLHPFEAFEDPDFLKEVQVEVQKLRRLVAKEMHRRFGKFSALDQKRQKGIDALDGDSDSESQHLPIGRDWSQSVISGIHAGPSMNHLHIHILSVDRHSECMKHRKHYNSFSTPFLIDVEDFPLNRNDDRRHPGTAGYMERDLKCWRCGKLFGNKFSRLKEHLDEEFDEWKKE
ncbi:MAG: hypothetical protein Q9175_000985 [Cornicularia normoerica]